MVFDHYLPTLSAEEDFHLDALQPLVWQTVIDALYSPYNCVTVKPIVFTYDRTKYSVPEAFFQSHEYKINAHEKIPSIRDVLDLIKLTSNSEWIIISHPDVIIKQNFYGLIEYYLASGHDAIAISTSNTMSPDISLIRRHHLVNYTWQYCGATQNIDCFVFSRSILDKFNTGQILFGLPCSSEAIYANLLMHSKRFKFLYEDSVISRFNNVLFWELNKIYDNMILTNRSNLIELFGTMRFPDETTKNENFRRLKLRIDNLNSVKKTWLGMQLNQNKDFKVETSKIPAKLTGSTWAVTAYFNPANSKKILENYKTFSANLKKQNVKLLTVELSFRSGHFDLLKSDSDLVVQIDDGDVLWQKERMFNLALKHLPKECDKIVYMDGDILFSDPDWIKKTEKLLEEYCFVQPFSHVVRLPKNGEMLPLESYEVGWHDGQAIHSFAYGLEKFGRRAYKLYPHHGTIGIAIAARRSVMEKHGWFDVDIVGSGDLLTIDSIMLAYNFRADLMNEKFKNRFINWQKAFREDVKDSLTYTPGVVYHLWHGSSKNRFYQERHRILEEYEFDPEKDINYSTQGVWKWSSNKKELHSAVGKYFSHRDDD